MPSKGIDALVEAHIREARARGVFDDLPGAGEPLATEDLAGLSETQRFEALVYRSAGELRPEVVLLREIMELRTRIAQSSDSAVSERLRAEIRAKAAELSALVRTAR